MENELELKVLEQTQGSLVINYEEFKNNLSIALEKYKGLTFTEEQISEAKKERAKLNAAAKTINERKKELKKAFLKPYEIFESQSKELIGMIDEVSSQIDNQIKEFEQKQSDEKKEEIKKIFDETKNSKVDLSRIWNDKWLNKTVTLKSVKEEIDETLEKIDKELDILEGMVSDPIKLKNLQSKYLINLDLNKAINDYKAEENAARIIEENFKNREAEEKQEVVEEEDKTIYSLTFEIKGTKKDIKLLSDFLKMNNYEYKRIK